MFQVTTRLEKKRRRTRRAVVPDEIEGMIIGRKKQRRAFYLDEKDYLREARHIGVGIAKEIDGGTRSPSRRKSSSYAVCE